MILFYIFYLMPVILLTLTLIIDSILTKPLITFQRTIIVTLCVLCPILNLWIVYFAIKYFKNDFINDYRNARG